MLQAVALRNVVNFATDDTVQRKRNSVYLSSCFNQGNSYSLNKDTKRGFLMPSNRVSECRAATRTEIAPSSFPARAPKAKREWRSEEMNRIGISSVALLFVANLTVFPATAGMDKIVGGSVHSIAKAHKNIKASQEEKKRIRIELESQFEMGYLLSGVRYTSTTNSPTGYVRVGGGNFHGIWKYLPEERRNELTENWNTSASVLHDKVIKCYETIQNKDSVLVNSFTTFTNAYNKFISDVANLPKCGQDDRHISLLRLDLDFKQMIDAGADIIHGTNDKGTGKDSMDIGALISFSILGLWITYWLIMKVKMLVDKYYAKKRFNELSDKIDAYTVRNGFKKPVIEGLGKESYIRFQTREPCSLVIAQGAKPDKEGRFQCSWVMKDPKDEDSRYICPPTDYQILFNPDTGTVEMLGLKN